MLWVAVPMHGPIVPGATCVDMCRKSPRPDTVASKSQRQARAHVGRSCESCESARCARRAGTIGVMGVVRLEVGCDFSYWLSARSSPVQSVLVRAGGETLGEIRGGVLFQRRCPQLAVLTGARVLHAWRCLRALSRSAVPECPKSGSRRGMNGSFWPGGCVADGGGNDRCRHRSGRAAFLGLLTFATPSGPMAFRLPAVQPLNCGRSRSFIA